MFKYLPREHIYIIESLFWVEVGAQYVYFDLLKIYGLLWFILYSVKLEMLDIKTQSWTGVDKKYMVAPLSGTSIFYYFKYFF